LPILGLDHVQLAMPPGGEDQARGFYVRLLGMAEVAKPPNLAPRGGCWFQAGTASVHLGVQADFRPATKAHPALVVDDLSGLRAALAAAGQTCTEDEPLAGCLRCYAADPFGNRIELMQHL
jgi:catechol 2,3-dioxygenase-like lactoylglutathione lyase family enzyme